MGTVTLKEWIRHNTKISNDKRRQMGYNCLSWIAYYHHRCLTHISDKEGTGWFLKELRQTRLIYVIRGACGMSLRIRLGSRWARV